VDWDQGMVSNALGVNTVLRAQSLSVLKALYQREGGLISKHELLDTVWQGVAVTDDSLVQCIAEIRKALGDVDHVMVKTIPKRGYVLSPVVFLGMLPKPVSTQKLMPSDKSLFVRPFVNMSGDVENNYFADGLTEDLITDLSNVQGFFVIARNSSFAINGLPRNVAEIAREFGVRYIIEGSVRRAANTIRINVQLTDCTLPGGHLWAERFDRDIADVFAVQDDVTRRIIIAIAGKLEHSGLGERYKPKLLDAYETLLRGRNQGGVSRTACQTGRTLMEDVLRLEPDYAAAHAELGLLRTCEWMLWNESEEPNRRLGDYHTKRGVELAPNNSRVLFSRGWVASTLGNYDESQIHFEKSLAINQNDADSWIGSADLKSLTGHAELAVGLCVNAFRLNPHAPSWYYLVAGSVLVGAQQYEEAVKLLEPAILRNRSSGRLLAVALAKLGRREQARQQTDAFLECFPQWSATGHAARRAFKFEKDREWWREAYLQAGLPA
jgi:TolB-like protein